ncbi:MAG: pilus assembly protein N-terminal domain-containing protein [bacterium]
MRRPRTLAMALNLTVFCTLTLFQAMAAEQLFLEPNKTTRLDLSGTIQKIMVSNQGVADARPSDDGKSVVIRALATGKSEIRIVRANEQDLIYDLTVRADLAQLAKDIEQLLQNVEGLSIKIVGDRIVLDGNLIVKSDYDRVQQIASTYAAAILNLTKLDRSKMNDYVAAVIQKDIGIKSIKVNVSGDTATLEGIVYDPADATMAMEKAKQRCSKIVSLLRLEEVMIETDVYFIMINTTDDKKTGFNLMKTLNINASASASDAGASFSVSANLMAQLNVLVGEGKAKFLATPHLSTKSGGTGKFHSGGEVFFQVSGTTGGSLDKVEHGVILTVKPVLRGQDRVVNEVTLQVSVPSKQPKGAFAIEKFETTSTTMSKIGESILISGLSQSLETQFKEKTPLLGDIPILSAFFSEKGKTRTSRDIVVVITPRPVFPVNMGGEAYSKDRANLIEK